MTAAIGRQIAIKHETSGLVLEEIYSRHLMPGKSKRRSYPAERWKAREATLIASSKANVRPGIPLATTCAPIEVRRYLLKGSPRAGPRHPDTHLAASKCPISICSSISILRMHSFAARKPLTDCYVSPFWRLWIEHCPMCNPSELIVGSPNIFHQQVRPSRTH